MSNHSTAATSIDRLPDNSDVETLLERFLVSIVALAQAQAGAVRVRSDDGKFLRLVAQLGLPATVQEAERVVELNCGLCGSAAATDQLGWVSDMSTCAARRTGAYFGVQCQRMLVISLTHAGQVLGVYNLFFDGDPQLDPQTENTLHLIGQLLGQAIFNARVQREHVRVSVMKERQEMLSEVHDAIAQTLAYVRMRLPLLSDAMLEHDDVRSLKYFSDVKTAVGEVHDNLREVMTYFRTRMNPLGLIHAVHGIADRFRERTGIALEIQGPTQSIDLTDAQEIQVFHIIQEALANISKHSRARNAVVTIEREPTEVRVVIEDDGQGIAGAPVQSGHFGLEIMQSRAQRLGGSLTVSNSAQGGVSIALVIPVIAPQGAFE